MSNRIATATGAPTCPSSTGASMDGDGPRRAWSSGKAPNHHSDVPIEIALAVLSWLPPNDVALSARSTCRAAAQRFAEAHNRTAAIGQPLPPHAPSEPLPEEVEAAYRALSFCDKLHSFSAAAASGSITNLEVALRLLQPFIFPELLRTRVYLWRGLQSRIEDVGDAAVKGGNVGALPWLLERCPGLVNFSRTLEAAARHCPLPQLREAWEALSSGADSGSLALGTQALEAAAGSPTSDAIAKMEWVMAQGGCALTVETAAAAASSGDLTRLRWMRERGCPFDNWVVLEAALRHADLSVADWLVGEAGCLVPDPKKAEDVASAAAASGSVGKLLWLEARGFLPEVPGGPLLAAAAGSGCIEALRFLHHRGGDTLRDSNVISTAASSGNVACVAYLRERGCPVDSNVCPAWYESGCRGGLTMLRWLLEEAHVPASSLPVSSITLYWPRTTAADRGALLEAVRMVVPPTVGSGWLDDTPQVAAGAAPLAACRGDLAVLRYLHEGIGVALDPRVYVGAVYVGCEVMLEWLVGRGFRLGTASSRDGCYLVAGTHGDVHTLECLRRLGLRWSRKMMLEAVAGVLPVPVLQWLWGHGARFSSRKERQEAVSRAAAHEDVQMGRPVVEWVRGSCGA